jgi:membrane associated rhomboid family serine protease
MGIHDRDYIREEPHSSLFVSQPVVIQLVIINAVLFVANILIGGKDAWLTSSLLMRPDTLTQPWMWWQFLTYGFVHSSDTSWHIMGNMFVLWMFGRQVENVYGRREFLTFYLTAIVLGGVLWSLRQTAMGVESASMLGASGGVVAIFLLYIFHFPKHTLLFMMFIPMPAWMVGVLVIGSDLSLAFVPNTHVAFDVHLIGATFAACYFYGHWRLFPLVSRLSFSARRKPRLRIRSASDDGHSPSSTKPAVDPKLESEADQILDKLHRQGQDSLTSRERKTLENYSRRMRQQRK